MQRVRAFFCLNPAPEVHARIVEFQEDLRTQFPAVKWVRPENLHLTIRFLGYVQREALIEMTSRVTARLSEIAPFRIEAVGNGFFPERAPYKVLWIGLQAPSCPPCSTNLTKG